MTKPTSASSRSDHLALWGSDRWGLWRWLFLRSAGFPAEGIVELADARCAAAADRLLDAVAEAERRRGRALDATRKTLKNLDRDRPPKGSRALLKLFQKLQKGTLPRRAGAVSSSEVDAFRQALEAVAAAREDAAQALAEAEVRLGRKVRAFAEDDRFREAVLWQNRAALKNCIDSYLRLPADGPRNHRRRYKEGLVVSYLQRYHTKNDTIGYFGPIGQATFRPSGAPVAVRCGAGLVAERRLFFELWGLDAVARRLEAEHPDLRRWLAPWRLPFCRLDGDRIRAFGSPPRRLGKDERAVLEACDGRRTAAEIAALALGDEGEVFSVLEALEARELIAWALQVPPVLDAERVVRAQLERVGDDELRRRLLGRLDELEAAGAAVARAAGDSARLDRALEKLERRFTAFTGRPAVRLGGQVYAGRTLVYEDCLRDVEVDLGPGLVDELGPPLSLLLESARWLTWELARTFRRRVREVFEAARARLGTPAVSMIDLYPEIRTVIFGIVMEPAHVHGLQERWQRVLELPDAARRVRTTFQRLAPRVREAFDAPRPGWRTARHHSIDLLISAPSADAIRRGDYRLVLGELHVAGHGMHTGMVEPVPHRDRLLAALDADLPEAAVVFTSAKVEEEARGPNPLEIAGFPIRVDMRPVRSQDYVVLLTADPPAPGWRTLAFGELEVREQDGELEVTTADGRARFELMDFFATALSDLVVHQHEVFPPRPHTPRVSVDRLVIQRESWRVPAGEIPMGAKTDAERFVDARGFARQLGLPRFVFVKSPLEVKPLFIDFDSPHGVALLARLVRAAARQDPESALTVTEMLPDLEHLWLPDADGRRYTSELRMIASDLLG